MLPVVNRYHGMTPAGGSIVDTVVQALRQPELLAAAAEHQWHSPQAGTPCGRLGGQWGFTRDHRPLAAAAAGGAYTRHGDAAALAAASEAL